MELYEYTAAVRRCWVWILVAGLLGAIAATTISALTPVTYASSTSLYFGVRSVTGSADLATGSLVRQEILPTMAETARSSSVLGEVIEDLQLSTTPERLAGRIDVDVPEDTAVLEIDVSAPSAQEAAFLAREIGASVGRQAVELYPDGDGGSLLEVTTLVPAREPQFQASPNSRLNMALGLVGGVGVGVLLSGLGALARPRIRTADDVAALTAAPVLGTLYTGEWRTASISRFLWALRNAMPATGAPGRVALSGPHTNASSLRRDVAAGDGFLDPAGCVPAIVHVPDLAELRGATAGSVDGLVVTVAAGRTTRDQLRHAVEAARSSPVPLLGVVVDGVPPSPAARRDRVWAALRGESFPGTTRRAGPTGLPGSTGVSLSTRLTAVVALLALGLDVTLPMATNTGLLAAVALLPVWVTAIPRYRGAGTIVVLSVLGLASGALLAAWSSLDHAFSPRQAAETGFLVLTAVGGIGLLLWARRLLPLWTVAVAYGAGELVMGILDAPDSANPYKFELALPLTIIVLAVADARRGRLPALAALAVLGGLNILNDARSAFGFCLVAAALVLWQARPTIRHSGGSRWKSILLLGGIATGGYVAISELLVAGALGAEVQTRSITQIEQTGSLLLGGRPEWTAAWTLMQERPLGFGLGTVPNAADVHLAESGFAVTNIPTAEGYIKNYMFGGRFELHSIVADLWSNLGVIGVALGLVMAGLLIHSFAELLSRRRAGALTCFLVLSSLWYLAFGPIPANLPDVALTLGLLLLPRRVADGYGVKEDSGTVDGSAPGNSEEPAPRTLVDR